MMNDDMIRNIDYLKEKADISYEEAATLLERYDGNVMRVLVELEHQGRVYAQPSAGYSNETYEQKVCEDVNEAKEKATSFMNRAFNTRLVVDKKNKEGKKETVANLSVPFAIGVTLVAPYLTAASAAIAICTGHNVHIRKAKDEKDED